MFQIKGKFTSATVYSNSTGQHAIAQLQMICNNEMSKGSRIAAMPDIHPGKAGPIGLTMTIGERIMPALVGADIGCGVSYIKIREKNVEYERLDKVIREHVPAGGKARKEVHHSAISFPFEDLICKRHINEEKALLSLGTLGGGNHFIELDEDDEGDIYAVVHSGSRNLGKNVSEIYMKLGQKALKAKGMNVPYELTCLAGKPMEDYLHDLKVVQSYAALNREIILLELAKRMKWKVLCHGESIHNYVDGNRILRKGAVSAYTGDEVIIPINMRDGIILASGKGNPEWNFSAPHGAGRILKRSDVKEHHTVSEYKKAMRGIHCATIGARTLDEAPFAYRGMGEIAGAIGDTATIDKIIKPIYNYKAGRG